MQSLSLKNIEEEAMIQVLDFIKELKSQKIQEKQQGSSQILTNQKDQQSRLFERLQKHILPMVNSSLEMEQFKKNLCGYASHYFQIQSTVSITHFSNKQYEGGFENFIEFCLSEFKKNNTQVMESLTALKNDKKEVFNCQYLTKVYFTERSILQKKCIQKLLAQIKANFDQILKQKVELVYDEYRKAVLQLYLTLILKKIQFQKCNGLFTKVIGLFKAQTNNEQSQFLWITQRKSDNQNLSVFPFFFALGFTPQYFNPKGHRKFPNRKITRLKLRGGIPYFQPIYGQRFGLNIEIKETEEDKNWLKNTGEAGEWAVGFIGVRSSDIFTKKTEKIIDFNIELCEEFMFAQSINNKSQKIGIGVAITPLFSYCLLNFSKPFTKNKQTYRMVLQCRFRPESLKCTKNDKVWIINYKRDVRPYGLILFNDDQTQQIAKLKDSAYKPFWKWSSFKNIGQVQLSDVQQPPTQKLLKVISKSTDFQNVKTLDLFCNNDKQKLTAEDMTKLAKVILPSIQDLNLQGNAVGDTGVEVLCQVKYDNLKQIDLNDNGVSLNGVSYLINNSWNKQVEYKLDTAATKDGGYALKAGENIKTIKTLIESSKAISNDSIDKLETSDKKKLYKALHLLMQTPLQGKPEQIAKQSEEMFKSLEQAVSQNPISTQQILLTLKNTLGAAEITFSKATNAKSQLSMKILTSGMLDQNLMIQHRVVDQQWNFKDFKNNSALVVKFEEWYKQKIAKEYKADVGDITIHKITEGSIQVWMSLSRDNFLIKNKDFPQKEELCVIPFFGAFNLSMEDFQQSKNYEFPNNNKCDLQWRAGIPYFQPVYSKRFAIKVLNLYDGGNNSWLSMDANAGQWGVAFHGINYPGQTVPQNNKTVLQSIMSGRQTGEMLRGGGGQAYQGSLAVNKPNIYVGYGIYISPHFTTSLFGYTQECKMANQTYRVLLQCRFKPEALKCTNCTDYWVINDSKNVRPYGIILVTPEQYKTIQSIQSGLYSQNCDWNTWKQQYQNFRTKHGLPL